MAEAALARYGLAGAKLETLPHVAGEEERTFGISFPLAAASIHPYLGRLAGKNFTLRMLPPSDESRASALEWVKEIAALCRDTDEAPASRMTEPVPACDGSLVTLIAVGDEMRHCLVYR
jgi:hypothetical protein